MAELATALSEAPRFDAAFRAAFAELLAWRRDVRHFRAGEAPDEATLAELFDLAALAPSVGNCQPTRFVRVDDEERRALIRANFEAANRQALMAYSGERAQLYAKLKLAGMRDAPIQLGGVLRRSDGAGTRPRRADHARNAPLFHGLRALHVLARRARSRPRRRLGLDPRSGRNRGSARRSTRLDVHRLSLRRLSARGASDPGARAHQVGKPASRIRFCAGETRAALFRGSRSATGEPESTPSRNLRSASRRQIAGHLAPAPRWQI